jgi:superfamily I DNA/RNA helicase
MEGMPWLGTFHSIGVKILRRHAELAGLKSGFTILDTDDQIRLIKQLMQAENLDDKRWPARQFAQMIDGWKNKGLGPKDIPKATPAPSPTARAASSTPPTRTGLDAERLRFRRPSAAPDPHFPRAPDVLAEYHKPLQIHPGRRISGHQHRPIHVAAAPGAEAAAIAGRRPRRRPRPPDFSGPREASREQASARP